MTNYMDEIMSHKDKIKFEACELVELYYELSGDDDYKLYGQISERIKSGRYASYINDNKIKYYLDIVTFDEKPLCVMIYKEVRWDETEIFDCEFYNKEIADECLIYLRKLMFEGREYERDYANSVGLCKDFEYVWD